MAGKPQTAGMSTAARRCWCGGRKLRPRFAARAEDGKSFRFVSCSRCGTVMLHPLLSPEELAPYYAAEYYGAGGKKFVGPVARAVEWFQGGRARLVGRFVPPGGRILDVGCGNGGFLLQMKRRGYCVEGTEWTAESAGRVPQEEGVPVHVGDLLSLQLPDAQGYDAITLWHVFEHLADPRGTIQEIAGLLRPGGCLFLSLPNQQSWQARLFGPDWFHLDPPRHLYGFGPRQLTRLARKEGFRLVRRSTWSLEQNPYGILQSLLNKAGFERNRAYETLKGTGRGGRVVRCIDIASVGLLLAPALMLSIAESLSGAGGTMTLELRREGAARLPDDEAVR